MNFKTTAILGIILLLLGSFIIYNTWANRPKGGYEAPPEVWSVVEEDIKGIAVILPKEDKKIQFVLGKDDKWRIDDNGLHLVDMNRWGGIVLLVTGPQSKRLIAEKIESPADFGLDSPQMLVRLNVDKIDQPLEIHIGDNTPNQDSYFIKLKSHEKLYTLDKSWFGVIKRLAVEPPKAIIRNVPTPEKKDKQSDK